MQLFRSDFGIVSGEGLLLFVFVQNIKAVSFMRWHFHKIVRHLIKMIDVEKLVLYY